MTLYNCCPHGYRRTDGRANRRCAECLRDAAMWSAFVHELRAEWLMDGLRRAEDAYSDLAIRCVCGRHILDNDVSPDEQVRRFFAWLDSGNDEADRD